MRSTTVFLLLALVAGNLAASDSNRVLLRVNDRIGTLHDYEKRRDDRLRALQAADMDPARRQELIASAGTEVLNDMLEELLVLSRADQIGYIPEESAIDDAIQQSLENFGIESEEQFEVALAQSGMTREEFREQVEVNLRVSGVMAREVHQQVEVTEEDARRYYYENESEFTLPERLELEEMVVLEASSFTAEEQQALAGEIRVALQAGAEMEELAETHKATGATSGRVELGWVERGDLDSALEDAVWDLASGEVSDPVAARGGLHILRVVGREAAKVQPFADVAPRILSIERDRLFRDQYAEFMRDLRQSAFISIRDLPADAQGFDVRQSIDRLVLEDDLEQSLLDVGPDLSSEEDG